MGAIEKMYEKLRADPVHKWPCDGCAHLELYRAAQPGEGTEYNMYRCAWAPGLSSLGVSLTVTPVVDMTHKRIYGPHDDVVIECPRRAPLATVSNGGR